MEINAIVITALVLAVIKFIIDNIMIYKMIRSFSRFINLLHPESKSMRIKLFSCTLILSLCLFIRTIFRCLYRNIFDLVIVLKL